MKANNFFIYSALLVITFLTALAHADDISVVDVRRNITLADDDMVYKDFYINTGEGSALRKNMVVNVKRKINVRDAGTKSVGDFEALVGQLKIIHIGAKVSVAREFKLIPRDEEPMLDQVGIMSGDRIDMTGSYIDNTKPVYKHKTSEAEPSPVKADVKTVDAAPVMSAPVATAAVPKTEQPAAAVKAREPAETTVKPAIETLKTPETLPAQQTLPVPQI
jgi:hypothetical protein